MTGNTIVDAIKYNLKKNNIGSKPSPLNKYITLTIHREENTLQINQLKEILNSVEKIAIKLNYDVFFLLKNTQNFQHPTLKMYVDVVIFLS